MKRKTHWARIALNQRTNGRMKPNADYLSHSLYMQMLSERDLVGGRLIAWLRER